MFEAIETIPLPELLNRHQACRERLAKDQPQAGGMLVFSRLAIYYLTGNLGNAVLWLPKAGPAVFLVRRGLERARLESPLENIVAFRSYGDIPGLCQEAGSPLTPVVAAEMNGLSWALANLLTARLPGVTFLPADAALAKVMAKKSPWELEKMRLCGQRHEKALVVDLPGVIHPGLTEREISHKIWEICFSLGHQGPMRLNALGEEIFLGHVSAGDSGNYPSVFNGPLGVRGEHPCAPFMGYQGQVWAKGQPLAVDIGFQLEGYNTDKTQIYWAGPKNSIPEEVLAGHQFCLDVQDYVAGRLKPGKIPSAIHAHCLDWAKDQGFAEGFMGLGHNKVSFLGHGIGLAIDGYPVLAKGYDEPLEEGMVLAVEPKLGLPGLGMVGVENTFEVTPQGGRCLTGGEFSIMAIG